MHLSLPEDPSREVDFLATDQPLRDDVRRLGALVGEILAEQEGGDFLAEVETIRKAAIARREERRDTAELEARLRGNALLRAENLVRAFGLYFQVVNLAERTHRMRRRRHYERTTDALQPGSLHAVLAQLAAEGVRQEELDGALQTLLIEPVFTAHPTEAVRRVLLHKERIVADRLLGDLEGTRTRQERQADTDVMRDALTSAWQTADVAQLSPTVADELDHVSFYLGEVLYHSLATFHEAMDRALSATYGGKAPARAMLRFGSWVGGDMDGNPNVGAATLRDALAMHRRIVLKAYDEDLARLSEVLTQSSSRITISEPVRTRIQEHRRAMQDTHAENSDAPYMELVRLMRARLAAPAGSTYADAAEFLADLTLMAESLRSNGGLHAGWFSVERLMRRAQAFGFHLASIDLRQDSQVHQRALDEPSSALGTQVLDVFREIARALPSYGERAFGPYIVSMTHSARDVTNVLALARAAGCVDAAGAVPLHVAPLFETIADLEAAPAILRELFADAHYAEHLRGRQNTQWVMLGYSDSAKDGSLVTSRWALQRCQVILTALAAERGVRIHFFHGRGGSLSRGGSKTEHAVISAPRGSVQGVLRVTEQGEVIHRKYGIRALALRNLEQAAGAVLRATLRPRPKDEREARWKEIADEIALGSMKHYRALVFESEHFTRYFRAVTPIDVIERMRLGSRPSRRPAQGTQDSVGPGPAQLRAIPWVFSWSQNRSALTAWYGAGTAILDAVQKHGHDVLTEMARDWPFFALLAGDLEMVLAKADLGIFERYSVLAAEDHALFFPLIAQEHARTQAAVLELTGQRELLSRDRVLRRSIRLRNPYIDPMSLLQLDLLGRWRATQRQDETLLRALATTVNGIAAGLQNTG